jgi:hypothetical protein
MEQLGYTVELTDMVIYGLLTYNNGQVFIPNKELMLKYDELLFRES